MPPRPTIEGAGRAGMGKRLLWFVALYAGGVMAVGLLAEVIRLVLHP